MWCHKERVGGCTLHKYLCNNEQTWGLSGQGESRRKPTAKAEGKGTSQEMDGLDHVSSYCQASLTNKSPTSPA